MKKNIIEKIDLIFCCYGYYTAFMMLINNIPIECQVSYSFLNPN